MGSFRLRIGIISVVGIISVMIGGHFGGGDHFDGGDHFGGGTGFHSDPSLYPFAPKSRWPRTESSRLVFNENPEYGPQSRTNSASVDCRDQTLSVNLTTGYPSLLRSRYLGRHATLLPSGDPNNGCEGD